MSTSKMSKEDSFKLIAKFAEPNKGSEALMEEYEIYGHQYDQILESVGVRSHVRCAEYVADILKDNFDAKIVDIAAGTGRSAMEISQRGYKNLYAVDPSPALLKVAKSKGCYRETICQFVGTGQPMPFDDDTFDLAVLSGAMFDNHLPISALDDITRVVRPGGYILNICREDTPRIPYYKGEFEPYLSRMETTGKWRLITRQVIDDYADGMQGLVLIHQVL